MKVIRDPLYGYIEADEVAIALIDTPEMQRIRRVRQLGFAYLVYPGANHTRFEHSLGTYALSKRISLKKEDANEMTAAALLHDVSHGPYSHASEGIVHKYTGKFHEGLEMHGNIAEVLGESGLDTGRIDAHIKGRTPLGRILNGEIDVDRMDYLVRDAYYTGVAFGMVDVVRLMYEMEFSGGRLLIKEGGLKAAESLLVSRFLMYPSVYFHHVSRIAECMFAAALERMIGERKLDVKTLRRMDDYEINVAMRESEGYPKEMIERINERRLFKRALYIAEKDVSRNILRKDREKVERETAEAAGLEEGYVLIDIPPQEKRMESASITADGKVRKLEEVSQIVRVLSRAHKEARRVGVYTLEESKDRVERVARKLLKISTPPH